jgi:hypothetical protein
MTTSKEWNLQALAMKADDDRKLCRTDHERFMCDTINRKEMRELWCHIKATRKPSPIDLAIVEQWGLE